jgi:probable HAF family extracellular repeat protein
MKTILRSIVAGNLLAVLAVAQASHYSVSDLGVVGPYGQPFNITNNGLVGGVAAVTSGAYHAVIWYRGLETDIGISGLGGPNSLALGVNVRAQAVGEAEVSQADPYGEDFCGNGTHLICLPFLWQFGLMSALPTLGGRNGVATGINSSGQAVGYAENAAWDPTCPAPQKYQFKPVLWTNGSAQELTVVAGDLEGMVWALNEKGQAAGASGSCAALSPLTGNSLQPLHALLWNNGTMTDLGNLGGTGHGFGILAKNLNNQGQVVGLSDLPGDKTFHAFLWTRSTGMKDLGTLPGDVASWGLAIDDTGVVTGVSLDDQFNPRAFIWQNGAMSDLNSLIPAGSQLYLATACSINSRGEIIGFAFDNAGEVHGYLATPVN